MKLSGLIPWVALLPSLAYSTKTTSAKCNADNCLRALRGTHKGTTRPLAASTDCSSYFVSTATAVLSTITVTETVTTGAPVPLIKRDGAATKTLPKYASACGGPRRYSSACKCLGVTEGTVTVTVDATTVTVTTTTTTDASPTPPGEGKAS
ncbi:hypothetical protein ABW19_dt0205519 [Dactylella cylindrospora]|nr:hypothetical protein ABW19_dt0205519 [Dactylella cylindrospora]